MSIECETYVVPEGLMVCRKGHLATLRAYLKSIGFPLANNEELNAPDGVIRLAEGKKLIGIKRRKASRTYYIAEDTIDDNPPRS